ncbi:glycosyltransferase [Dyadobacter sp. CY323]|uniref:glycosyltransferase n=1 Tax=Dyadobacter sp. CY323 TaxID=2907302 RepID=UPI001F232828|nr:nucleotide disphospho-sugar-binding domain-containing protein [Dyadobacter sp. CY323]MCE6991941.1 glycosyltransferase [Dyadobacter sp. CY323]
MKKILFANMPYDGHFNPLTGIAMHLKSLGHDVRWYSGSYYQPKAEKLGIPFYPFKKALDFNQHNVNEIFPERVKLGSQLKKLKYDLKTSFVLRSTEFYEDIREINESWCFDLMISDIAFTGLPFVKELLNKKVISIGVFPLTENSRDLPPAGLAMLPSETFWGRRKQDILRFVADQVIFRESAVLFRKMFQEYGIKPANGNPFDILGQKSNLLLQSGSPGFEYKRSDLSENIRFVGALLPFSSGTQKAFEPGDKLKGYEKVILVTQGTLEKDPEKIIIPTLEAFKDSKYMVIATTGGSRTEELRKRFPYKNIIVEDFIPFNDIMPHSDVYITNGGYGGVMLGIENELPMLVAGIHEGKNEINARVGYFKIGIDLKTEFPNPGQILKNIETILTDSEYKSNVKKLSRELKEYDTIRLCEKYVNEVLEIGNERMEVKFEYL